MCTLSKFTQPRANRTEVQEQQTGHIDLFILHYIPFEDDVLIYQVWTAVLYSTGDMPRTRFTVMYVSGQHIVHSHLVMIREMLSSADVFIHQGDMLWIRADGTADGVQT